MRDVIESADNQHSDARLLAENSSEGERHTRAQRRPLFDAPRQTSRSTRATTLVHYLTHTHRITAGCPLVRHTKTQQARQHAVVPLRPAIRPVAVRHLRQIHHQTVVLGRDLLRLRPRLVLVAAVATLLQARTVQQPGAPVVAVVDVGDVGEEAEQVEVAGGEVSPADDAGHRLRVYGVRGEEEARDTGPHRDAALGKYLAGDTHHQPGREAVQ